MPAPLPAGEPLRFPGCPRCPYLQGGTSDICFRCANRDMEQIATPSCSVCGQFLADGQCPNWLCTDPGRRIARIHAIAYSSGPLRRKILSYKYDGKSGWATIFGRILVGWLDRHSEVAMPDLIVANPTWVPPDSVVPTGHTERVVEAAEREDVLSWWEWDIGNPRAIVKTRETPRSAKSTAYEKEAAADEHGAALRIPDAARLAGRDILVYDDVCTTGRQLDAVAGVLLDRGGAASVSGVVLARAPWRK